MTEDEKREAALSVVGSRLYWEVSSKELDKALTGRYKSPTVLDVFDVKSQAEQMINRLLLLTKGVADALDIPNYDAWVLSGKTSIEPVREAPEALWQYGRDKGWY